MDYLTCFIYVINGLSVNNAALIFQFHMLHSCKIHRLPNNNKTQKHEMITNDPAEK